MQDTTRAQGFSICAGAGIAALLFLIGIFRGSYWALAIPVAVVTLFALGLVAWVGFTIATIQIEADHIPDQAPESSSSEPSGSSSKAASGAAAEDAA
jgi:hypothetical protein